MLKFEREDDERGKVVVIKEPYGLIKHERWPSLFEVAEIASQQFPEASPKQIVLSFFSNSHGHSYLQLYKRK